VGTTNETEILRNASGADARRFWIVEPTKRIDLEWIELHRDSLWGEAYALALSYADHYVPAIVGLGYVDLLQGNMAEARRHADRARDLNDDDPRGRVALNNLRTLLHQVERDGPGVTTLPSSSYGGLATTASR